MRIQEGPSAFAPGLQLGSAWGYLLLNTHGANRYHDHPVEKKIEHRTVKYVETPTLCIKLEVNHMSDTQRLTYHVLERGPQVARELTNTFEGSVPLSHTKGIRQYQAD
jgi:hypothetical protein